MRRWTFGLALALVCGPASAQAQTASCSSGNFSAVSVDTSTVSASKTVVIPADVPAGATLFVAIMDRTDESTTLTSVSDPVNGTWSSSGTVSGPTDSAGATFRTWGMHRLNSAALTGAGNRTLTVTTSTGVSTQLAAGFVTDSGGAMTFDELANVHNDAANDTNHDSTTISLNAAGLLLGAVTSNNAITTYTADGAGESVLTGVAAGVRLAIVCEPASSGGSRGFELTSNPTLANVINVHGFLSPGGGGGGSTNDGLGLRGVGDR